MIEYTTVYKGRRYATIAIGNGVDEIVWIPFDCRTECRGNINNIIDDFLIFYAKSFSNHNCSVVIEEQFRLTKDSIRLNCNDASPEIKSFLIKVNKRWKKTVETALLLK